MTTKPRFIKGFGTFRGLFFFKNATRPRLFNSSIQNIPSHNLTSPTLKCLSVGRVLRRALFSPKSDIGAGHDIGAGQKSLVYPKRPSRLKKHGAPKHGGGCRMLRNMEKGRGRSASSPHGDFFFRVIIYVCPH